MKLGSSLQSDFWDTQWNDALHFSPYPFNQQRELSVHWDCKQFGLCRTLLHDGQTVDNRRKPLTITETIIVNSCLYLGKAQIIHIWMAYACVLLPSDTNKPDQYTTAYNPYCLQRMLIYFQFHTWEGVYAIKSPANRK